MQKDLHLVTRQDAVDGDCALLGEMSASVKVADPMSAKGRPPDLFAGAQCSRLNAAAGWATAASGHNAKNGHSGASPSMICPTDSSLLALTKPCCVIT